MLTRISLAIAVILFVLPMGHSWASQPNCHDPKLLAVTQKLISDTIFIDIDYDTDPINRGRAGGKPAIPQYVSSLFMPDKILVKMRAKEPGTVTAPNGNFWVCSGEWKLRDALETKPTPTVDACGEGASPTSSAASAKNWLERNGAQRGVNLLSGTPLSAQVNIVDIHPSQRPATITIGRLVLIYTGKGPVGRFLENHNIGMAFNSTIGFREMPSFALMNSTAGGEKQKQGDKPDSPVVAALKKIQCLIIASKGQADKPGTRRYAEAQEKLQRSLNHLVYSEIIGDSRVLECTVEPIFENKACSIYGEDGVVLAFLLIDMRDGREIYDEDRVKIIADITKVQFTIRGGLPAHHAPTHAFLYNPTLDIPVKLHLGQIKKFDVVK